MLRRPRVYRDPEREGAHSPERRWERGRIRLRAPALGPGPPAWAPRSDARRGSRVAARVWGEYALEPNGQWWLGGALPPDYRLRRRRTATEEIARAISIEDVHELAVRHGISFSGAHDSVGPPGRAAAARDARGLPGSSAWRRKCGIRGRLGSRRPPQGQGDVVIRGHSSRILTKFLRNHRLTLRAAEAHFDIPSPRTELVGAMRTNDQGLTDPVTIRPATRSDIPAIASLAELDSARVPRGRVLLAELRGRVVAAISLESGALFADPFVPTAEAVKDLRAKAAGVRLADDPETGRRGTSLMTRVREVRRRRQPGLRTTS
jgi:hypothetical protein